jgi:hypothetical protein
VIEDHDAATDQEITGQAPPAEDEPLKEGHQGGFHVRAVPIDQPFDEE